jgi:hypothetical protein
MSIVHGSMHSRAFRDGEYTPLIVLLFYVVAHLNKNTGSEWNACTTNNLLCFPKT